MTCPGDNIKATKGQNFVRGIDFRATRVIILSGKSRHIINKSEDDDAESISSNDDCQSQPWNKVSELTSNSDVSEFVIHLVEWKQRVLDREIHQDPDRNLHIFDEEDTVLDNAADELEFIAVSKRPTTLLPHAKVVSTNLEPTVQEATTSKRYDVLSSRTMTMYRRQLADN